MLDPSSSPSPWNEPSQGALPEVREIQLFQCGAWLKSGWADTLRGGWVSWVHGLAVAAFGWGLIILAGQQFWLLAALSLGF